MYGAFSHGPPTLRPSSPHGPTSANRSTGERSRHGMEQKRPTMELPPESSISSDFQRPKLERSDTVQSYLSTSSKVDPYPARFYDEPEVVFTDHDTIVQQIHSLFRADLRKVPKGMISRSTTGCDTPSRTSSIDPLHETVVALSDLALTSADIYDGYTSGLRGEHEHFAGSTSTLAATPGSSRAGGSKAGTGKEQSQTRTPGHKSRASVGNSKAATGADKVKTGRVTKGAPLVTSSGKKPETEKDKEKENHMRLGCPMVKANPDRYMSVIGPCTDLRGLAPKPKALMEHLKKQHSNNHRCQTCSKWFKGENELRIHQSSKLPRCTICCKEFKHRDDLEQHMIEASCEVDEMSRPEFFTPMQEKAFEDMKNQSSRYQSLEQKYRWCFRNLFPHLGDAENVWIYYDFASFTHKLPIEVTTELLTDVAGGLRSTASPGDSPSEEEIASTPASGQTETSPVATQHFPPRSDPSFVPPRRRRLSSRSSINQRRSSGYFPMPPAHLPELPGAQVTPRDPSNISPEHHGHPPQAPTLPSTPSRLIDLHRASPSFDSGSSSNPGITDGSSVRQGPPPPTTPSIPAQTRDEPLLGADNEIMPVPLLDGDIPPFDREEFEKFIAADQLEYSFNPMQWLSPQYNPSDPNQAAMPPPPTDPGPAPDENQGNYYPG